MNEYPTATSPVNPLPPGDVPHGARSVGYVVSRFPKTTETFILREMQAVEANGWDVWPFAINFERREIVQSGADRYLSRLTAISELGLGRTVRAQARLAVTSPRTWARLWWRAISGNIRSRKFLLRAIVIAWGAPALSERAEQLDLDHLHAHWGTHSALLAHLMSMVTGLPYSITLHAHDLHIDRTMLARKLHDAAAVVTISEHNAEIISNDYPDVVPVTSIVHCGVDTAAVPQRDTARSDGSAMGGPIGIVCVAGLRGFKGHQYLLAAIDLLHEQGIEVLCDLVGDGPLRAELEAAARPEVVFHGAVDVDRALEIVARADMFVMPSVELADGRRDGIPVALMEAMAIGVPVIASSVSGIPELVQDGTTGVLVPPADPVAIAAAITELAADPERADRLVASARRLVADEFDISATGRKMVEIFERVATPSSD
jgi:colanic acid/amylovoran biosynthesis glycosyltransferase